MRARILQAAAVVAAVLGVVLVRHPTSLAARSADPTFADDIAPIFYANCTTCHRPNGQGPFSLLDYETARQNRDEIRDAVATGYMPPWHAEGPHGVFQNDRRLSTADKQTILRWAESGAKSGDLTKQPPKPVYPSAWTMGKPDAIVAMPEPFTVPANGTIEYQYFEVPTNFAEDKWVQAIEILPGAREVVHHVLVYARVPALSGRAETSAATPRPAGSPAPQPVLIRNRAHGLPDDPPRVDTRHAPPRSLGTLIGTETPGNTFMEFPKGAALRLRAGTVLTFQMHYTAHGHEIGDRTSVGFRFAAAPPDEEIHASQFVNGSFTIPAGAKDVAVPAEIAAGEPVKIWGLMPHTHLRGKRWQYKLVKPDGTSEIVLDVPNYDFNWQTYYMFAKPLEVPAGGKLMSTAWYDNSASNQNNPDATRDVRWGDQTWEEMQYTGMLYSVPSRRRR